MKYLLTILLFTCSVCFAQTVHVYDAYQLYKKPLNTNDKIVMASQFVSGAADGINQAIQVHGLGAGKSFWDYQTSWKRKYKDFDAGDTRAAYLFSKSAFVAGTDGYHLTRFISRSTMTATIIIDKTDLKSWKAVVGKLLIMSFANRLGFWLTYDVIFK